jgi:soluble lytic murein transglycosylase-like protein
MNIYAKSLMAILLTGLVFGSALALTCTPVNAQIVSVLDEHGQRVYINTAPPPPRVASPSKSGSEGSNATKRDQSASGLNGASPALSAAGASQSTANGASHGLSSARLEELVQTTAARHGVDANLVRAVIETESGGNPSAVSRKGAVGLMQLMPTTALENLEAGVRYLHTLIDRYGGDLDKALAAYNAGAGAVDRAGGVPHYRETVDYVKKVTNNYFAADAGKPTGGLSAPHSGIVGAASSSATNTSVKATAPAATKVVAPPANKIYKTTDASGHTVWAN